jgi:hypothetical protein
MLAGRALEFAYHRTGHIDLTLSEKTLQLMIDVERELEGHEKRIGVQNDLLHDWIT